MTRSSKPLRRLNSPPTLGVKAKIRKAWYSNWLERLVEFLKKWLKFLPRPPSVIDPIASSRDDIIGVKGVKEIVADDIFGVKWVEEVQADNIIGVVKEVQAEAEEEVGQAAKEVGQAAKEVGQASQIVHERQQVGQAAQIVHEKQQVGQTAQIVHERQQVGQTAQIVHERQQVGPTAKKVGVDERQQVGPTAKKVAAQIVDKREIVHERQRNSCRYISYTNTRAWARIPSNTLNPDFVPAQYSIHLQYHGLFEEKNIHKYGYPSNESLEIHKFDPALRKRMSKAYVDISQDNLNCFLTCLRAWMKHGRWFGVPPEKYFEMAMNANDMFNRDNRLGESISPPVGLSLEEMRVGHVTAQRLSDILYDVLECEFSIDSSNIDSNSQYLTNMPPGVYESFDGINIELDGANQPQWKHRRPRLSNEFASTMMLL